MPLFNELLLKKSCSKASVAVGLSLSLNFNSFYKNEKGLIMHWAYRCMYSYDLPVLSQHMLSHRNEVQCFISGMWYDAIKRSGGVAPEAPPLDVALWPVLQQWGAHHFEYELQLLSL